MSLFLHGVVRASHRLPECSPFRLIGLDELAVVVSDRRENRELTEEEATAHLAELCALLPGGPVLPLRIGTVAVDEAAARAAVLALRAPLLRQHLDRLDGLAEMHVRLVFDEDTALRAVHGKATFTARGADLTSTIAGGEQIAREIVAWRRSQADAVLAPVSAMARSVALLEAPEHTEELRAYLVRLDEAEGVRAAVAGLGGVVATCTGPLPAFHFLDLAPRNAQQPASRWGW
ncbi:GvpL/GvpF family gas vesicle protein [Lentzea aerocolonigenes]|uniref:GvpL/GvpF family gas vesicle protein n=1 Tax=Lentzea aerocolonigenes TaxID=68170 RepID=UPI000689C2BE|nr:GvpL/GvpF family gas vesicle protein [Lentzea aerocolonigenes]MCP2246124.1 Gas vesicle synthesis protein GvpL/GvpF [Lentzea aerocolonigenes]